MSFPKMKHPLLCRIATYVAVLGAFLVPMIAVICIPAIPEPIKAIVSIVCTVGLLIYLFRNFAILMALDICLATMQGYTKAYRRYPLQLDAEVLNKRLSRFGKGCEPVALQPKPQLLRFKSTAPVTVYSSGIEKVVAVYRCGLLTKAEYSAIVDSGITNSQALAGKKKHLLLDHAQKTAPLNRVTVILILAAAVAPDVAQELYDQVCKKEGDGFDRSVLPCVVDLSAKTCVFNSPRMPYWGMQYPVKNRGIRLIERYIFSGRLPQGQGKLIEELEDHDPDMTLWQFWGDLKKEWRDDDRKTQMTLQKMTHGQICTEEEQLLIKWEDRGAQWSVQWEDGGRTAVVQMFDNWVFPKVRPMSKKHLAQLQEQVRVHLEQEGCAVRFVTFEEDA